MSNSIESDTPMIESDGAPAPAMAHESNTRRLTQELAKIRQAIVFAAIAILGGLVAAVVALGAIDWFVPTIAYFVICYLAWTRVA